MEKAPRCRHYRRHQAHGGVLAAGNRIGPQIARACTCRSGPRSAFGTSHSSPQEIRKCKVKLAVRASLQCEESCARIGSGASDRIVVVQAWRRQWLEIFAKVGFPKQASHVSPTIRRGERCHVRRHALRAHLEKFTVYFSPFSRGNFLGQQLTMAIPPTTLPRIRLLYTLDCYALPVLCPRVTFFSPILCLHVSSCRASVERCAVSMALCEAAPHL